VRGRARVERAPVRLAGRPALFDASDFDETLLRPVEHDVERLVASLVVATRGKTSAANDDVGSPSPPARYWEGMAQFAGHRDIDTGTPCGLGRLIPRCSTAACSSAPDHAGGASSRTAVRTRSPSH
jgi:uncharacterized protein DUF2252